MLVRNLEVLQSAEPIDETIGLSGLPSLWCLIDPRMILMKADKGNCFVVLDSTDYNNKMNALLNDRNTYELVSKSPFRRIERELNNRLLTLKNQQKICDSTYRKLRSTDSIPPAIRGSIKHHKGICICIIKRNAVGSFQRVFLNPY